MDLIFIIIHYQSLKWIWQVGENYISKNKSGAATPILNVLILVGWI